MIINSVRTYIQSITAMHVFGAYLLPVLDLGTIIKEKLIEDNSTEP
jgi:hypothetical protein